MDEAGVDRANGELSQPPRSWFLCLPPALLAAVALLFLMFLAGRSFTEAKRQVFVRESVFLPPDSYELKIGKRVGGHFDVRHLGPPPKIPWMLWWAGGHPMREIVLLPAASDDQVRYVQAAFPEANVHRYTQAELDQANEEMRREHDAMFRPDTTK